MTRPAYDLTIRPRRLRGFTRPLQARCETQEDVDDYWEKLSQGVSWQAVPSALLEMLNDPDRARSDRGMAAMLQMKKLEIGELRRAYAG